MKHPYFSLLLVWTFLLILPSATFAQTTDDDKRYPSVDGFYDNHEDDAGFGFPEERQKIIQELFPDDFNFEEERQEIIQEIHRDLEELSDGPLKNSLRALLDQLKHETDEDAFFDLLDKLDELYDEMEPAHRATESKEVTEHFDEMCKEFMREVDRFQRDNISDALITKIKNLVEKCENLVIDASQRLASGEDPWEVDEDTQDRMDDLWENFDDIMESFWEREDCSDAEEELRDAKRGIEEEAPEMIKKMYEKDPGLAKEMEQLVDEARSILDRAWKELQADNCDEALDYLDILYFDLSEKFFALMKKAGFDDNEHGFGDYEDDYEDFYDEFDFEDDFEFDREDMIRYFEKKKYGAKDLNTMKHISVGVMEDYLRYQQDDQGSDIIQYGSEVGLETYAIQNLMRAKNDLLAEIEELKRTVVELQSKFEDIVANIEKYNFDAVTAKKAKTFMEKELPNLSHEEAENRLDALKEESRTEKYSQGIIPFKDTDDDQWYTPYAAQAKKEGLVQGTGESNGTRLEPGRNTNVAEAIALFARINGIDPSALPQSEVGKSLPDWAKPAAGSLADRGVDLDDIFGKDTQPNNLVTRGELALLLNEVLDLKEVDSDEADIYSDIGDATSEEKAAIAAVSDAGIMTGYGDSDAFGVDDPLNRAALVKTLDLAKDKA